MLLTVLGLVVATMFVAIRYLAPRLSQGNVLYGAVPDAPTGFGYRMAWLAVRTRDTGAVVEALGLIGPHPCNWRSGIGAVYDRALGEHQIFVSPPVNGWTFVVGLSLPQPVGRHFVDKSTPFLLALGTRFVEVQYFMAYPPIDFFAWARMLDGRLVRAFAVGDVGVLWNKGKPTREERTLGLRLFELRGVKDRRGDAGGEVILHPTEDHVMRIAAKWSLDPTKLGAQSSQPGLGVIARAPAVWRAERLKASA
ncbi:MAG: hypothetical protein NW216_07805 [Hyphomicrobium sp.]|nr:hypothetical protein [Hyphomicrobium sp.]